MSFFRFRTENLIIGKGSDLACTCDCTVFHALIKMFQLFFRLLTVHYIFLVIDHIFHGNKMDIVFFDISVFDVDGGINIDFIGFLVFQLLSSFLMKDIVLMKHDVQTSWKGNTCVLLYECIFNTTPRFIENVVYFTFLHNCVEKYTVYDKNVHYISFRTHLRARRRIRRKL